MSLHRASGAWRRGCVLKRVAAAHPSEVSLFPTVVTDRGAVTAPCSLVRAAAAVTGARVAVWSIVRAVTAVVAIMTVLAVLLNSVYVRGSQLRVAGRLGLL